MPYGSENYEVKGIGGYECNTEPPLNTMKNMATETVGALKELLKALDDTAIVMFGAPIEDIEQKPQEPKCLMDSMAIAEVYSKSALRRFMEMRKRMV